MEDYIYQTEQAHANNLETMDDFLENELPQLGFFLVLCIDGTYAEIERMTDKKQFEVHAGGNGDFCNHRISFVEMS